MGRRFSGPSNVLVPNVPAEPREPLPGALENVDPIESYRVTVEEAERLVRSSKGRMILIAAHQFARDPDQSGVPADTVRGRDVMAHVRVSKRRGLEFIAKAYQYDRDRLLSFAFSSRCLFIG